MRTRLLATVLALALTGSRPVAAQQPEATATEPAVASIGESSRVSSLRAVEGALALDVVEGRLLFPDPAPEPRPEAAPEDAGASASTFAREGSRSMASRPFSTGRPELDRIIEEAGRAWRVDPYLIYCVMHQESGFQPRAVSHAGASGYMQLMPATARRLGVTDIFDPRQNVFGGAKYLRTLLDMFGDDVALTLAAYNAGEGRVIRSGYRVPDINETKVYVRVITGRYGRTIHRPAPAP